MQTGIAVWVRCPLLSVDHSVAAAFFNAHNDALQVADEIFSKILQVILVTFDGRVRLGAIDLKGGFEQIPTTRPFFLEFPLPINVIIHQSDIPKTSIAYDLVSAGKITDKTLTRAMHRFLLCRQRIDLVDKLVD